jgi:hypothetical protein
MRIRFIAAAVAAVIMVPALLMAARAASIVTGAGDAIPQLGATPGKVITTVSTNCSNIKSTPATLFSLTVSSTGNTANYVKLFDLAAAPTAASSTPILTLVIPNNSSGTPPANPIPETGLAFSNGLGICVTGNYPNFDNTNSLAGHTINYSYK